MNQRTEMAPGSRRNPVLRLAGGLLVAALIVAMDGRVAAAPTLTRISVAFGGGDGNGPSLDTSVSADGRYIAFESAASNLVEGDTNNFTDVFVHDRMTGTTTRVSGGTGTAQANGHSGDPSISADGRYVAFESLASNLAGGDSNGLQDVFWHDRVTGTTLLVSISEMGFSGNGTSETPDLSADGRYVAFHTFSSNIVTPDTNGQRDVLVRDTQLGLTTLVSQGGSGQGDFESLNASISADGTHVAFESAATNLLPPNATAAKDVYVRNLVTGQLARVSVTGAGDEGNGDSTQPDISADGKFVAFRSAATDLVTGDMNMRTDIFVRDLQLGVTTRISVSSTGVQGNSGVRDPSISGDGRYVVWGGDSSNMVPNDLNGKDDAFFHDRATGTTSLIAVTSAGVQGDGHTDTPAISSNGRYIVFETESGNLGATDGNGFDDIYLLDRGPSAPGGTVTLQGRTSTSPPEGHSIATVTLTGGLEFPVATDGTFTLVGVADGDYTITACAPGYLCAEREIEIDDNAIVGGLPPVQLPAGSAEGDGVVNIVDVVAIIAAFGSRPENGMDGTGRVVDVNGDGVVNLRDLTLTLGNFGKVSPVAWP